VPYKPTAGLNKLLIGFPSTGASALCTFAYSAGPGTEPILFEGRTQGRIVPPRGSGKFGWDPIFEAEDTGKTYVPDLYLVKKMLSLG
jgi:inosine triphosphate pyrophosphatase